MLRGLTLTEIHMIWKNKNFQPASRHMEECCAYSKFYQPWHSIPNAGLPLRAKFNCHLKVISLLILVLCVVWLMSTHFHAFPQRSPLELYGRRSCNIAITINILTTQSLMPMGPCVYVCVCADDGVYVAFCMWFNMSAVNKPHAKCFVCCGRISGHASVGGLKSHCATVACVWPALGKRVVVVHCKTTSNSFALANFNHSS